MKKISSIFCFIGMFTVGLLAQTNNEDITLEDPVWEEILGPVRGPNLSFCGSQWTNVDQ